MGWRAVPNYLAMSYLRKRSNRLWRLLIRHRLTGPVWRLLVGEARRGSQGVAGVAQCRQRLELLGLGEEAEGVRDVALSR